MAKKPAPTLPGCQPASAASPVLPFADSGVVLSEDLIPDRLIARGINMLAGASGVGKTALCAGIARNLRDGRAIFGHQPRAVPSIVVINSDRGWRTTGEWYRRAGFAGVRQYSIAEDLSFDERRLQKKWDRPQLLFDIVKKMEAQRGSVIIPDPVALFLGGNLLDYDACACACIKIRKWLEQNDYTMIALAHSAKLKADKQERYARMQDQILGSTALLGYTDTQMYLASPEETGNPYYTFLLHSHLVPPEFFALERDEQGLFVPYSGADEGNCTRVLLLFPDDDTEVSAATLTELATAIPLSRATLYRVLQVLVERERIALVRRGHYRRVVLH